MSQAVPELQRSRRLYGLYLLLVALGAHCVFVDAHWLLVGSCFGASLYCLYRGLDAEYSANAKAFIEKRRRDAQPENRPLMRPWLTGDSASLQMLATREGIAIQRVPAGVRFCARIWSSDTESVFGSVAPQRCEHGELFGLEAELHWLGWHLDYVTGTDCNVHILDGYRLTRPDESSHAERLAKLREMAQLANDKQVLPCREFRVVTAHEGPAEVAEALCWFEGQDVLITDARTPFHPASLDEPPSLRVLCRA